MSEVGVTCPNCCSTDIMFSKKRQVYVCEDCGHEFTEETHFVPKRVFISYGHDEHMALAVKLRDDLKAQGHLPWFDGDRLPPGQDWERNIEEGLAWAAADKANGAVALLMTPHSVRRPEGYCLNEVARALSLGLRVIPMMVVDSEPPLSICRIQWLDLRPCIPISQKEALYQPRFERFLETLVNPTLDFEGNQQRLLKALQPLDFDADILFHLKSFVGRDWVFNKIDAWLTQPDAQRVFWIAGAPGVGKTAICAWLSSRYIEIGAMHLCKFGHRQKGDPAKVVASLAYQLTTQLPEYEALLMAKDIGALALDDARTMFDNLIVQPLSKLSKPERPVALLIDALDEATHDGQNTLAGFIASEFPKTPDWLRLIITSRPEPEVTGPLQRLTPFVLDTACQDNINDIRDYIEQQLKEKFRGRADANTIVQIILDRSEYIFLYVQRVCQDVLDGALSLDAMDQFPKGLGEAFWQFFERQFGNTDDDKTRLARYKDRTRPALRAILAAREPLPIAVLQSMFQWSDEELNDFTIALGSLFPVDGGEGAETIKPYHKAIADWLADKDKSKVYYVSLEEGAKLLAEHGWREYRDKGPDNMPLYFLRHLPAHLIESERIDNLLEVIQDWAFLEAKTFSGYVFDLAKDYSEALNMLSKDHSERHLIALISEAFRRDIYFVARHFRDYPQALFQCLWNSCWWYDCPEAEVHYLAPESGWEVPPPWNLTRKKLYKTMERWRKERERKYPGFPWIRSRRPPIMHLGTSQRSIFHGHESTVNAITYSSDGLHLASASADRTIRIWESKTGSCLFVLEGHAAAVESIMYSYDGRYLLSGSRDGTVCVWDTDTRKEVSRLTGHTGPVWCVAISHDNQIIASASEDHTVRTWDKKTGKNLHVFRGHQGPVNSIAFSPADQQLVSGSDDCTIRVWDVNTGKELIRLYGHTDFVKCVSYSPDGTCILSGSCDNTARLWNIQTGKEQRCLIGHTKWVTGALYSTTCDKIISVSRDMTIRVWDAVTGKEQRRLEGHMGAITGMVGSPRGETIGTCSEDRTIRVWDLDYGENLRRLKGHTQEVKHSVFSPDYQEIASCGEDARICFWDVARAQEKQVIGGNKGGILAISYSPDGKKTVSGSFDRTVRVWDVQTGREICCLSGHQDRVTTVAFSPDGKQVASGSRDNSVRIWSLERREELFCFRIPEEQESHEVYGFQHYVMSITYSPVDGCKIVSGNRDGTVRVFDMETKRQILCIRAHKHFINHVAYSADGSRIVSDSYDNSIKIWDAGNGECIRQFSGMGDVCAVAAGSEACPLRAMMPGGETIIENAHTGEPVAYYPLVLGNVQISRKAHVMAGHTWNHVHILNLEGGTIRPAEGKESK